MKRILNIIVQIVERSLVLIIFDYEYYSDDNSCYYNTIYYDKFFFHTMYNMNKIIRKKIIYFE